MLFLGLFRRRHPPPSPPKYLKSPRSPASTFPHSIQLLLDCLPSARLVSISPRGDYFCTFAHGKFLASPTRSNSATAVTSCGDSLSRAGKPLGLQMGLLTRRSNRHSSPPSTVSILLQFLTPERIFFSSPATFQRQSESSSLLQQLLDARAILLLFSSDFLRQSDSSSLLQRFPTPERFFFSSVFTLQKFLLSSLFLVVWMMPSPYSPSSFTLQSPDCSGIFLPDAFLSRFHGNHFSPRCHHKDFRSDIFSPSPLPAGTQVAGHFPKWSKSPFLNEKTSRGCVHNFGFGNLLGVLLTLRNDSSSS